MPLVKIGTVDQEKRSTGKLVKIGSLKKSKAPTFLEELPGVFRQSASLALGDIPKSLVKRFDPEMEEELFPEQETMGGKVARAATSIPAVFGGIAAKGAAKAGSLFMKETSRFLPKAVGLVEKSQKVLNARKNAVLIQKSLRGAAEVGAFSGIQQDITEEGIKGSMLGTQAKQLGAGAFWGGTGALLGMKAISLGSSLGRGIKKGKLREEQIAIGKTPLRVAIERAKSNIDESIKKIRELHKEDIFKTKQSNKIKISNTAKTLRENSSKLDEALSIESEKAAREVQVKLPEFYKANSKEFGRRLDDTVEKQAAEGKPITIGKIEEILNKSKTSMDEALIEGRPQEALKFLRDKYGIKTIEEKSLLLGPRGEPIQGDVKTNVDDIVDIKEFYNDWKKLRKFLSSGAQSGTTRFTQEDTGIAILNHDISELLPALSELRASYSPIIQAMKTSNRIFKPYQGKFETRTGADLLKRFGMGKFNEQSPENQLIKAIEEGNDFAPGIGQITAGLKEQGKKLIEAKNNIKPVLDALRQGQDLVKQAKDKNFAMKLIELQNSKKFVNSNFIQKEELISGKLAERLKELGFRKERIDKLMNNKENKSKLIRRLLWAGGLSVGGFLGSRFLGNLSER